MGRIIGTTSNDLLNGTRKNDAMRGKEGHDTLEGNQGSDTLYGGQGNDSLDSRGDGDQYLDGGAGNDTLINRYKYNGDDLGVTTYTGDLTFIGGSGNDYLKGGDELKNSFMGGSGNDTLDGQGSINNLYGGSGDDTLQVYKLQAEGLINNLYGGVGNDFLATSGGKNILVGGNGDDTLYGSGYLNGGAGNDTYNVSYSETLIKESSKIDGGIDTVKANAFSYTLGPNLENLILIDEFSSVLVRSSNFDLITLKASASSAINFVDYPLESQIIIDDPPLDSVETFIKAHIGIGNDLNNIITGQSNSNNKLYGEAGNDSLIGGFLKDSLNGYGGGNERDLLTGGKGIDSFVLGDEFSSFYSNDGDNDYAVITDLTRTDRIVLHGNQNDYQVKTGLKTVGGGASDTGIYTKGGEAIAFIQDSSLITSMNDSIFQFV